MPDGPIELSGLSEPLAAQAAAWLTDDEGGRRRVGFYAEHPKWWRLVHESPDRHGFIAWQDGEPVGLVDLELEDTIAHVAIFVRRRWRNVGIGRRLLRLAASEAKRLGAVEVAGDVEQDNLARFRCCIAAGLHAGAPSAAGLIPMRLRL